MKAPAAGKDRLRGETSRLMLGLKNVLARADQVPSLIFDEIDQGIADVWAWWSVRNFGIFAFAPGLCVTHLPNSLFLVTSIIKSKSLWIRDAH
ncbi:hypothetical protein [Candidatus Villigracilis affinis]|uniref:hypothetical protein n=1 Tax=Candidatus Villigracilis affinis TaxID=3140682 RepID=UPI002A1E0B86|nr:hypothetical protein [Anaerolineales bacterium]